MATFDSGQLASLRSLTEVFGPMCLILGLQRLLPDRQRPQMKELGFRPPALVVVEYRQAMETLGHVGVLRAQSLFPNRQGASIAVF
jgi:hypothetical protein